MKKNLSRVLAFLLSLVMCAGMLPTGVLAASVPGITEVTYYGKNPDTSVEGEMANYPAVTVTFNGGSTNLEVFSLTTVASESEGANENLGMSAVEIEGQWYRADGLWTVEPSLIQSGAGGSNTLTVPLYYPDGNPGEGANVYICLYDYEASAYSNALEVTVPAVNGSVTVTEGSSSTLSIHPAADMVIDANKNVTDFRWTYENGTEAAELPGGSYRASIYVAKSDAEEPEMECWYTDDAQVTTTGGSFTGALSWSKPGIFDEPTLAAGDECMYWVDVYPSGGGAAVASLSFSHRKFCFVTAAGGATVTQPTISPRTADLTTASIVPLTFTKDDGSYTFDSIQKDGVTLAAGTDYTVSGSNVTLSASFLSGLGAGTHTLTFRYTGAAGVADPVNPTLTIRITQYVSTQPTLSQNAFRFNSDSVSALTVTKNDGSFTFDSLQKDGAALSRGTDYTVSGNNVTIAASFLSGLGAGTHTITFHYAGTAEDGTAPVDPALSVTITQMASPALTVAGYNGANVTEDCTVLWTDSGGYTLSAPFTVTPGSTVNYTVTPGASLEVNGVQYYKETSGEVTLNEADQPVRVALGQQGTLMVTAYSNGEAIHAAAALMEDSGGDLDDNADVGYTVNWYVDSASLMAATAGGGGTSGNGYSYIGTGRTSPMRDAGTTLYYDVLMDGENRSLYPNLEKASAQVAFGNTPVRAEVSAKNNITLNVTGTKRTGGAVSASDYAVTWYTYDADSEAFTAATDMTISAQGTQLTNISYDTGTNLYYEIAPLDGYRNGSYAYNWLEFHGIPLSTENRVSVISAPQTVDAPALQPVKTVAMEGTVANGQTVGRANLRFSLTQSPWNGFRAMPNSTWYYSNEISRVEFVGADGTGTAATFSATVYDFDATVKVWDNTENFGSAYRSAPCETGGSMTADAVTLPAADLPESLALRVVRVGPYRWSDSGSGEYEAYNYEEAGYFQFALYNVTQGRDVPAGDYTVEYNGTRQEIRFDTAAIAGEAQPSIQMGDTLRLSMTVDADKRESLHADLSGTYADEVTVKRNWTRADYENNAYRFDLRYNGWGNLRFSTTTGRSASTYETYGVYDSEGYLTASGSKGYWHEPEMEAAAGSYTLCVWRSTGWLGNAPAALSELEELLDSGEYQRETVTIRDGSYTVAELGASPALADHTLFTGDSGFLQDMYIASNGKMAQLRLAYEVSEEIAGANPGATYAIKVNLGGRTPPFELRTDYTWDNLEGYDRNINLYCDGVLNRESRVRLSFYSYNGLSRTPNGFTLYTDRPSGVIYFNLVGGGTTGKYSISAEGWLQESGSERKLQTGSIGSTTLSVETASNCDLYFTSDFLRMPDNGPDAGRSDYENGLWVYTVPWETVNLYLDDVLIASQRSGDGVAFFSFKMDESLKTKFSSGWSRTGTHTLFAETVLGDGTTVRSMTYQRECLSRTDSVRPAVLTGLEMQSTGVHGTIRPSSLLYYKGTTLVSRGERNQVYSYYTFQAGNSSYTFTATVENADWVDGDLLLNLTTGALDGYTVPLRRVAGTNTFSGTIDSTVPFSMWEVSFSSVRPAESGQVYAGEKPLSEATLLDVAGSGDTVLDYNGNPVTVQALYDSVYNHFMDEYGDREDELRSMIQEDAAMELDALGEFFQSVAGITGTPLPEGLAFDGSDACLDYLRQYLGINVIYPLSENAQLSAYRSWDSDCAVTTTLDGSVKREYTRIVVETSETDGKPHLYEMLITIVENPAGSDLADYGIVKVTDCGVSSLDAARFANTDLLAWLGALDLSDLTGGTLAELLGADDQRGKSGINAQSLTNIAVFDSGSTNTINQINAGLKKVTETINGGAAHSDSLYWNLTKQSKDQLYVDRDTGTAEGAALTELETRINNLKEAGEQSGKLTQEQISTLNELLQVVKDVYEVHVEHVARELAEAGYDGAKSIREVMDALKSVKDMSKHMAGEAVDDAWNRAYESDSNWYKYNPLYWALRPVAWVTNVLDEYDAFNQLVTDNAKRLAMDPERYLIKDPAAKKHRENMEDALINLGYVLNELNYEYDLGVKNPSWNVRLNTNAGRNTPIIDPQGIVYEAVLSNPVEGATATLYERTGDGAETAWDATDYGQINPQTTDSTGQYQWFVPEGEWQVRVSAPASSGLSDNTSAGHDAANLDDGSTVGWLPVMPVQLGINIPLTSTESPVVQSANVYAGYAEVVFSRYVDVSTLTADAIAIQTGGAAVPCTLSFPDQDADPLDSSKLYAKTVRLTPVSGGFESGASYTVTVADSVSGYNGRTLPEAYQSGTLTTGQASAPVLTPDKSSLNLTTGGMETVTITLKSADNTPMAGVTVNGTSDKTSIATVTASVVTDSEGKAAFTVTGGRSGGAAVTFATADGLVEASVNVTVSEAGGNGGGTGENPGENPSSETKYTVTFNSNGGSAVAAQSVVSGGKAVRPANPTKSGYNFDNWYVSSDFATVFDFNSPVNNNMTLYANWTAVQQTQKRGCYVATAVYGSYDCPEVWTLRRFRDQVLARTWYGRLFIKLYYAVSPTAVRLFGNFAWFQDFFRSRLDGMVSELQSDGFASTPYDDPAW